METRARFLVISPPRIFSHYPPSHGDGRELARRALLIKHPEENNPQIAQSSGIPSVLATTRRLTPSTNDRTAAAHHHHRSAGAAIPPAPGPPLTGRNPRAGHAREELAQLSAADAARGSSATAPLRRGARDFFLIFSPSPPVLFLPVFFSARGF